MLYPIATETRHTIDLNGIWTFLLDDGSELIDTSKPIQTEEVIAVPGSFNDQAIASRVRNHDGSVWYERESVVPTSLLKDRLVLRFGSVTHQAVVYLNGEKITEHKGGFTPFEVEINDSIKPGKNRLLVEVSTLLDYTSLPIGNYSKETDENGQVTHKVDENFDFFNYGGLHRPVKIYSTPKTYIEDITVVPEVSGDDATVHLDVTVKGDYDHVRTIIIDEDGQKVATTESTSTSITIEQVNLWKPMNAYLYTARVEVSTNDELIDVYEEPFGIRTVEVKDGQFYINGQPFYFKGFGKHEDAYYNGRGLNESLNVMDLNLFKWIGANSFRTSHYPYSEEMMRLADRMGIVVIDETPAVGLLSGFSAMLSGGADQVNTWEEMETKEAHEQVFRELIA